MTILPKIDRTEVDEAVASIVARREKVDTPHFELLTDDPGQVPRYLRKYGTSTLDFDLPDWVRAADVHDGLEAAGVIHSDFRRGFIKDEVVAFDDVIAAKSMSAAKAAGKVCIEGKECIMADGDVVEFRFNV